MSRSTPSMVRSGPTPTTRPAFGSRPRSIDYFFMLCGVSLSILLTDLCNMQPTSDVSSPLVQRLLRVLPEMLLLPLGVLLLWPLFYLTQWALGRKEGITSGEWLWGVAWLGALALAGWICWHAFGTPPEMLAGPSFRKGAVL